MHSYKLLVIIILIMKKTRPAIYFEKRYCLLVHSLILNQRMTVAGFSQNSCEKEVTDRTCSYNLNQILYVNCIDVIRDGVTTSDSEVILILLRLYFTSVLLEISQIRKMEWLLLDSI